MTGKIIGISGPTVRSDMTRLKLYERVSVGRQHLTGEVVRLEPGGAVIQVYEETRGLAIGEPVTNIGKPLSVSLGPGLLSMMYDGLQRPLKSLWQETGPFMQSVSEIASIDLDREWDFSPLPDIRKPVQGGDILGFVREGAFQHPIIMPADMKGEISWLAKGAQTLKSPVCVLKGGTKIYACQSWPVRLPRPYRKKSTPHLPMITGQRIIDFLFPVARGGVAIFPGGFGTGKTVLEQAIAKFSDVDIVIYAGCGERGNEMSELIEEFFELKDPRTDRPLIDRTVLIVNTSNMPVAAREASIYTAVSIGEYYRDLGFDVLLLADSVSRWAEALREISSSLEEIPGEEGYPTYLASRLASFVERAGVVETLSGATGSLSMILSVSPPGGDFTEPVTQALLRTTGAYLMLDSTLAHSRHFPAINWTQSYSLYEEVLSPYFCEKISTQWEKIRYCCRDVLRQEEALKEVVEIIGMEGLQVRDRLLMTVAERIRTRFLTQNTYTDDAFSAPEQAFKLIKKIIEEYKLAQTKIEEGAGIDDVIGPLLT